MRTKNLWLVLFGNALALCAIVGSPCVTAAETVTYYYTNEQGTPLATTDAAGNIVNVADYRPYGEQTLGSPAHGAGYTGHVNDADTDFIYMQARYYDPTMGRFLSIDAVRPTAGDVASMNDFAYVGNNPIGNIDPSGNYICNDSPENCEIIAIGIHEIGTAAAFYPKGSAENTALSAIASFYGNYGEDNGVSVTSQSITDSTALALANSKVDKSTGTTTTNVTFDLGKISSKVAASLVQGVSFVAEVAAVSSHEGQHGLDGIGVGNPATLDAERSTERRAYNVQADTYKGLRANSVFGFYHAAWIPSMAPYMRAAAINQGVASSVKIWCSTSHANGC